MQRVYAWELWSASGFTTDDLAVTVRHLKSRSREPLRAFRFEWFIGNTERFGEDLAEARALLRGPKPDPGKESVLKATGRTAAAPEQVVTPAQVLAGNAALKALLDLRDSL